MEQRDIIKDQVEELGRVLKKIIADFLGLQSQRVVRQGIEISNEALKDKLDLDVELLLSLSREKAKTYLAEKQLTAENLEILATYFEEIGIAKKKIDSISAKMYLKKALELLDFADEFSKTMSFSRMSRKAKIQKGL